MPLHKRGLFPWEPQTFCNVSVSSTLFVCPLYAKLTSCSLVRLDLLYFPSKSHTLLCVCCGLHSSVQFSRWVVSDSLWPHGLQHTRPPCPSLTPRVYSNSCALSSDAIQSSHPLSSPSPPAFSLFQHQGLFQRVGSLHQVAKVLEVHWIFRTDLL